MKTVKTILIALSIVFCASVARAQLKANEAEVTFQSNLHCDACKAKVEKNIPFEKGFVDMNVKLEDNTIYVKYNSKKTDVQKLQKAIEKLGYMAKVVAEKK